MAHLDAPYEERTAVKDRVDEDERARHKAEEVEVGEQTLGHFDLEPPQRKARFRGRRSPGPELAVQKNRVQPACMLGLVAKPGMCGCGDNAGIHANGGMVVSRSLWPRPPTDGMMGALVTPASLRNCCGS